MARAASHTTPQHTVRHSSSCWLIVKPSVDNIMNKKTGDVKVDCFCTTEQRWRGRGKGTPKPVATTLRTQKRKSSPPPSPPPPPPSPQQDRETSPPPILRPPPGLQAPVQQPEVNPTSTATTSQNPVVVVPHAVVPPIYYAHGGYSQLVETRMYWSSPYSCYPVTRPIPYPYTDYALLPHVRTA